MKKNSIVIAMFLVVALTVSAFAISFADVPANHWAYEAVNKLVAAGLITGYPDGTFKGQNTLTRYEVATILARLLNSLAEMREEMMDQVTFMIHDAVLSVESGLSEAQAEDVQAILQAVIDKNTGGAAEGLTTAQAEEIYNTIADLAKEFDAELLELGIRVGRLERRVANLEGQKTTVTFSGEVGVALKNTTIEGDADKVYKNPFNIDNGTWHHKNPAKNDDKYDDGDYYGQYIDLNVAINNDNISVNLDFMPIDRYYGSDAGSGAWGWPHGKEDSEAFEIGSISGNITTEDFTAKFGELVVEYAPDFLMTNSAPDLPHKYSPWEETNKMKGVHLVTNNGFDIFVGKENERIVTAGSKTVELLGLELNTFFGTDYNPTPEDAYLVGFSFDEPVSDSISVNGEIALSNKKFENKDDLTGRVVRLGANANIGILDLEGKVESTKDFTGIEAHEWFDANKEGFNVKATLPLETGLGNITTEASYESYDFKPRAYVNFDYEGELFGLALSGNYRYEQADGAGDDDKNNLEFGQEKRNFKAVKELGIFTVSGEYSYEADNEGLEAWASQYGYRHAIKEGDGVLGWEDKDVNQLVFTVEAALTDSITITGEYDYDLAKEDSFDPVSKKWAEDTTPNDFKVGAKYNQGIFTAFVEKELNQLNDSEYDGKLTLGASVEPEAFDLFGINVSTKLDTNYYIYPENDDKDNALNLLVQINGDYAVNDRLNLNAGYEYNQKEDLGWPLENEHEIKPDHAPNLHGKLQTFTIGLDYKINNAVTANAGYKNVDFAGKEIGTDADVNYNVDEYTAGVIFKF